jgi:hypothetical protein
MRELTQYGDPDASAVLIQPVDDHDLQMIGSEIAEIRRLSDTPFRLIAYPVGDWNRDLSPWNAPAAFGKAKFGDGAFATLRTILSHTEDQSKTLLPRRILAGRSVCAVGGA